MKLTEREQTICTILGTRGDTFNWKPNTLERLLNEDQVSSAEYIRANTVYDIISRLAKFFQPLEYRQPNMDFPTAEMLLRKGHHVKRPGMLDVEYLFIDESNVICMRLYNGTQLNAKFIAGDFTATDWFVVGESNNG